MAATKVFVAIFIVFLTSLEAGAQALSVVPVNVFLTTGQKATSLTIRNSGDRESTIQIRGYAWNQKAGEDQLIASNDVVLSPPLVKIAPGVTQVVRLILRQLPENQEATYRILIDQIPPPVEPGIVHMVLRLSIPIFVLPSNRAFPDVRFHVERTAGQIYLVGINYGILHDAIRDIVLTTNDGRKLKPESSSSPYVLAGATRRWHLIAQDSLSLQSETFQLTAHANADVIEQQVRVVAVR